MPRTTERTEYQYDELGESAKDHARDSWRRGYDGNDWTGSEILDSIRAVVGTFGTLDDYRFGAYDRGANVRVSVCDDWGTGEYDDDGNEICTPFSLAHFARLMSAKGYAIREDGRPDTCGICGFTGICYDDDIIDAIADALESLDSDDDPAREIGHAICNRACRIMEDEYEYETSDAAIDERLRDRDCWYDEDGNEID